jgi:hypothetical protein
VTLSDKGNPIGGESRMSAIDASVAGRSEQTRALYPTAEGYAERDGVSLFYEVYGAGEPTVLLMPTWEIVHSRLWRGQIPYLARHCRVVCFDPRGNSGHMIPRGHVTPPAAAKTRYRPPTPGGRAYKERTSCDRRSWSLLYLRSGGRTFDAV